IWFLTQQVWTLPILLYFSLLEGRWGCSLGKRLLRLRVRGPTGGEPGMVRAGLRMLTLYTLSGIWFDLFGWLLPSEEQTGTAVLLGLACAVFGLVVLLLSMRARNGYRGLHERISGTKTVRLPWPARPYR